MKTTKTGKITFQLGTGTSECDRCAEALEAFKESLKRVEGGYGAFLRDEDGKLNELALGLVVRPDRNAHGIVTGYHVSLTTDED